MARGMRTLRTALLFPLILVASLVATALPAPAAHAAAANRSNAVLLIHGIGPFGKGENCESMWRATIGAFKGWGWTGPMLPIAYYAKDEQCSASIDGYGSHNGDRGTNANHDVNNRKSHGFDTPIEHLAYHLAWYISQNFTSKGKSVDVIGYSMGGLIIRMALARVERRMSGYPSQLLVGDVVTWGTPHDGSSRANECAPYSYQCSQMSIGGSPFLQWLKTYAWNPQANGGTDWTAVGSRNDNVVKADSATYMGACHMMQYGSGQGVGHTGNHAYMNQSNSTPNSSAKTRDCNGSGQWWTWTSALWPVRHAFYALSSTKF